MMCLIMGNITRLTVVLSCPGVSLLIFSFSSCCFLCLIHCLTLEDQHSLFGCQVFILHTYLFFPGGSTWLIPPFFVEPSQRFRCCPSSTCRHIWLPDSPPPRPTRISYSKVGASSLLGNIFSTEMESASVYVQITHFFVSQVFA